MPEEFIPSQMRAHAKEVSGPLTKKLETTLDAINEKCTLEGGDFSITGTPSAVCYPGALQFAFEDLKTHMTILGKLAEGVEACAENYKKSEEFSSAKVYNP